MVAAQSIECHTLARVYLLTRKMCLSAVTSWLHVSFSLLHSAIDYLRGAQSSKGRPANLQALDLATSEGQLSSSQE